MLIVQNQDWNRVTVDRVAGKSTRYCGCTNEDQQTAGYNEIKTLANKGAKNFVIIKYAVGVATCDDREKGANKAIQELGLNKIYTIVAPQDVTKSVQDVLTNHPNTDAVVALGASATYLTPSIQAIKAVGKTGKIQTAAFDFYDGMATDIKSKDCSLVIGGHVCTSYYASLMCISSWLKKPLNPDKKQLIIPYLYIDSPANIDKYNTYVVGSTPPYSADEMKQALSCGSFDALQKIASKYSLDDIIARHKG